MIDLTRILARDLQEYFKICFKIFFKKFTDGKKCQLTCEGRRFVDVFHSKISKFEKKTKILRSLKSVKNFNFVF